VRRSAQLEEVSPQPLMKATPPTLRKVNETKIRITPIPFLLAPEATYSGLELKESRRGQKQICTRLERPLRRNRT
jgi:hypothetical protein